MEKYIFYTLILDSKNYTNIIQKVQQQTKRFPSLIFFQLL